MTIPRVLELVPLPAIHMELITISPVSLVLGALAAAGLFLVMGQAGPGSYSGSWGPPKMGVVNIFESSPVTIPPGGIEVVYQVPLDRWLTVTGAYAKNYTAYTARRWSELSGGAFADKGFAVESSPALGFGDTQNLMITPQAAGGTVGWVFRPGSQVVLRNTGGSQLSVDFHSLTGYETRDGFESPG